MTNVTAERVALFGFWLLVLVMLVLNVAPTTLGLPNTGLTHESAARLVTYPLAHQSIAHASSNFSVGLLLMIWARVNRERERLLVVGGATGALAGALAFLALIGGPDRVLVGASALVAGQIAMCVVVLVRAKRGLSWPWRLAVAAVLVPLGGWAVAAAHLGGLGGAGLVALFIPRNTAFLKT